MINRISESLKKRCLIANTILLGVFYFSLSYIFNVKMNTYGIMDYFFDSDCPRVVSDIINITDETLHYRTVVHPFFLVLVQPLYHLFEGFYILPDVARIMYQTFVSLICAFGVYKLVEEVVGDFFIALLSMNIFSFSFSTFVFSIIPETYLFAAVFLIWYWYYVVYCCKYKNVFGVKEYFLLVIWGICCFGITITNICTYGIGILYLLYKKKIKISKLPIIALGSICSWILIGNAQKKPFATIAFYDVFTGKAEYIEGSYVNCLVSFDKVKHNFFESFFYTIISPGIGYADDRLIMEDYSKIIKVLICMLIIFVIVKIASSYKKKEFIFPFMIVVLFNYLFHLVYGDQSFLYSAHWVFAIVVLFAYMICDYGSRVKYSIAIMIVLLEVLFNGIALKRMVMFSKFTFGFYQWLITDYIIIALFIVSSILIILGTIGIINSGSSIIQKVFLVWGVICCCFLINAKAVQLINGNYKKYDENSINIYLNKKTNDSFYCSNNVIYDKNGEAVEQLPDIAFADKNGIYCNSGDGNYVIKVIEDRFVMQRKDDIENR